MSSAVVAGNYRRAAHRCQPGDLRAVRAPATMFVPIVCARVVEPHNVL